MVIPDDGASTTILSDLLEAQERTVQLAAASHGSVAGSRAAASVEESLWLCPIEDRRGLDSTHDSMIQGFSLGSYVDLVKYAGLVFRHGKASISAELAGVLERPICERSPPVGNPNLPRP
jgi:hypothetical protein